MSRLRLYQIAVVAGFILLLEALCLAGVPAAPRIVELMTPLLRSLGAPAPVSFAYPAYVTTPTAIRQLRERGYTFARTGGDRAYDPVRDDPMLVPSWTLRATSRDTILAALSQARDGRIVVLTIHGVPDTAHPWVTTPVETFEELLRALKDGGYRVVAMRDVARYLPPERRPASAHAAPR